MHPEVQRKAQAEIDEVLNVGQLPTVEDRPKLVYVQAVIREVSRWLPPAPLSQFFIIILYSNCLTL